MEKYFVDAAILFVILFCGFIGYKNGILSGIITIASSIISVIGAKIITPFVSPYVGRIISPLIENIVLKSPEKYIEKYVAADSVSSFFELALEKSLNAAQLLSNELTLLTQDIVAFFIVFVIIVLLSNRILRYVSLNFPIIKTVNRFVGLVFGAFVGLIIVVILYSATTKYIQKNESYVSLLPYFEQSYFSQLFLSKFQGEL